MWAHFQRHRNAITQDSRKQFQAFDVSDPVKGRIQNMYLYSHV